MKPRFTGIHAPLLIIWLIALLPLAALIVYSTANELDAERAAEHALPGRNAN
jgi:hypothetical protein